MSASVANAAGVVAAGGWPSVATVFSVHAASAASLQYTVNGGVSQTAPLHAGAAPGTFVTDPIKVPFGAILDCTVVSQSRMPNNVTTVVADAAFDWNVDVPVRRTNDVLDSMAITIFL